MVRMNEQFNSAKRHFIEEVLKGLFLCYFQFLNEVYAKFSCVRNENIRGFQRKNEGFSAFKIIGLLEGEFIEKIGHSDRKIILFLLCY